MPDMYSTLDLIASGHVRADQDGSIFLPEDAVPAGEVGETRLLMAVAIERGLAFRLAPFHQPGVFPVHLTTLGEVMLRRGNPDRYQSKHAFGMRDGQVTATEVAR